LSHYREASVPPRDSSNSYDQSVSSSPCPNSKFFFESDNLLCSKVKEGIGEEVFWGMVVHKVAGGSIWEEIIDFFGADSGY
jgi:hypothetical protein